MKIFTTVLLLLISLCLGPVAAEETAGSQHVNILELPRDSIVVFGEFHGNAETPAFLIEQVATLLGADRAVMLGLELEKEEEDLLHEAMSAGKREYVHERLLKSMTWRLRRDGRSSVDMADLLWRMGELDRQYPGKLKVFAFDVPFGFKGDPNYRDRHMAEVIAGHYELRESNEQMLVLAGNVHAFVTRGAPWKDDYESMAYLLQKEYPVLSLRGIQAGGESWVCTGPDPEDCGPRAMFDHEEQPVGIYLEPYTSGDADEAQYHGRFFVGRLTASPPLVSNR